MKAFFLAALMVGSIGPAKAAERLSLSCPGSLDNATTTAGFFGPTKVHQQIPDQVSVEIENGEGRARVPRKFFPMFARVQDGWAEIINLRVGSDEIDGSVNLGPNAKPKLHIDRRSGSISVEGILGRFFGECKAIEAGAHAF
jgi:hypothetical protein